MARRDLIQDTDRPHYYSQYWIDVAQGRQKASPASVMPETASPIEEDEEFDDEAPMIDLPKVEAKPKAAKTKEPKPEPARPTLNSLADLANIDLLMRSSAAMADDQSPDIAAGVGPGFDESVGSGFDLANAPAADEEEEPVAASDDLEDFDNFDEDEEEDDWGGGPRRKKGPSKPAKRREQRRDF